MQDMKREMQLVFMLLILILEVVEKMILEIYIQDLKR